MKKTKIFCTIHFLFLLVSMYGQRYSDALTTDLHKHYDKSDLPGFSVAIADEDGILYKQGFGFSNLEKRTPFSPSTVENLGSVSKTIVGLALIKVIEERKVSLDSEINDFLPFKVINPYYPDNPILIRHLATHTSSILDTKHYGASYVYKDYPNEDENVHQEYLDFIKGHDKMEMTDFLAKILDVNGEWYKKKNFLKTKPGTQKEYANLNAALVALIIEKATGMSFKQYTQEKIFARLGMKSTTWTLSEINPEDLAATYFPAGKVVPKYSLITYPDGGLYSSVDDLTLYLQEIIKAYSGNSDFLSSQFAKLLLPGDNDENRAFWGMGQKSRNIGHGGSDPGVQTDLQFNADSKIGRIIMTNVNAEDNEKLWQQYREIHNIISKYESKIKE